MKDKLNFALIGNPNCGKTTLFNGLTGSTAKIANWPGVTVDKKTGVYRGLEEHVNIIDLPGVYSLSPYSPEEVVSRDVLLSSDTDCVINIIDGTNLERNLYLTTQILELDLPVVVALNMSDLLKARGYEIDLDKLSKKLGVPVVEISALRKNKIDVLMKEAYKVAKQKRTGHSVLATDKNVKDLYSKVVSLYDSEEISTHKYFKAAKIIEGDQVELFRNPAIAKEVGILESKEEKDSFDGDYAEKIADARYRNIETYINDVLTKTHGENEVTKSEKIDKVLTHRIWAIPIFLVIMFIIFHFVFSSNLLFLSDWAISKDVNVSIFGFHISKDWVSEGVPIISDGALSSPGVILQSLMMWFTDDFIAGGLHQLFSGAAPWVGSLLVDGIWTGIATVLSFVPQILLIYLFILILQDTGYMARAAFVADRAFRKLGMSGKTFMPLLMCFGCAVPGILATKALENKQEKKMAIYLSPFYSCGAKLPIWTVIAGSLFAGAYYDLIVFGVYIFGIIISIICAFVLKLVRKKEELSPFIMELPEYRAPSARNVGSELWEKFKDYLKRAATVIAASMVVLWFLSTYGYTDAGGIGMVEINESFLSNLGKGIGFIFAPLGFAMGKFGWMFVVATFTGLVAKENVPATLSSLMTVAGVALISSDNEVGYSLAPLIETLPHGNAAMFSFMAFNLLTIPCMAAVGAASKELGKGGIWKAILFWLTASYSVSLIVYLVALGFEANAIVAGIILLAVLVCFVAFLVLKGTVLQKKRA